MTAAATIADSPRAAAPVIPPADAFAPDDHGLIGLARLMTAAFRGVDLTPLTQALIQRAERDVADANALMDLSVILFMRGLPEMALGVQAQALRAQRVYTLPAARTPALRLLAIMTSGDLMTNAPLPFLLEDSDVELTMLYVLPGEPLPETLPAHDVLFVAISQSDRTRGLLQSLQAELPGREPQLLNAPCRIVATCRDEAFERLAGLAGVVMPATARVARIELAQLAAGDIALPTLLPDGVFPLIVRPVDSHAGHGLEQVATPAALATYLDAHAGDDFFISRFVDYRGADGLFRKARVALVDGRPFAAHMAVSSHWMIHYLNAGMTESADKRDEEARFMLGFDEGFGRRHAAALAAVAERFGLDYLVLDCAETRDGELLVFEMDPGAVCHSMDPDELFPYKRPAMHKLYAAFRALLQSAAERGAAVNGPATQGALQ
jgi:hypothetical protein